MQNAPLLFYLMLFLDSCSCKLSVVDSGTLPFDSDDSALIFYMTVENKCGNCIHVSVKMKQCLETVESEQYLENMDLIGGDMGTMQPHGVKNLTLIYPNLYLYNRVGICTVVIDYENLNHPGKISQLVEEICFNTTLTCGEDEITCESPDLDPTQNCAPVDCRIKYSGHRSYFDQHLKRCVEVPSCCANLDLPLPDVAYNPVSNQCKNLNNIVTKADLELLEDNNYKDCGSEFAYGQFMCHHGYISNRSGECVCFQGWITSLEDNYEPSLGIYHFCNVEINGWINVNKSRIKITALLIAIFAVTIASKILIIMCILSMCFKWAKSPKNSRPGTPLEQPCICNEQLIQDLSKQQPPSGNQSQVMDYTCQAIFTESPFMSKTPKSKPKPKSTSSTSSGEDEIHIYVERSKSSKSSSSFGSKFSNTDFSIEFVDDEETTHNPHKSSSATSSKKRVRIDHTTIPSTSRYDSRNVTSMSDRDFTTDTRTNY